MSKNDDNTMPNVDLQEMELAELLMIVGSFIFGGNSLSELDSDIINRLHTLINEEYEYRLTGRPPNAQIH
tara:strand:+ start:688 stop:897 length:210 start_codon:yes stop_codon:yes gene_type:complete